LLKNTKAKKYKNFIKIIVNSLISRGVFLFLRHEKDTFIVWDDDALSIHAQFSVTIQAPEGKNKMPFYIRLTDPKTLLLQKNRKNNVDI
jgi:hypothetical protein